jgi:hypothetical protein
LAPLLFCLSTANTEIAFTKEITGMEGGGNLIVNKCFRDHKKVLWNLTGIKDNNIIVKESIIFMDNARVGNLSSRPLSDNLSNLQLVMPQNSLINIQFSSNNLVGFDITTFSDIKATERESFTLNNSGYLTASVNNSKESIEQLNQVMDDLKRTIDNLKKLSRESNEIPKH